MYRWLLPVLAVVGLLGVRHVRSADAAPEWVAAARQVHARFKGQPGTFAQFGDSITVTQAFWSPLRYERRNASPAMEQAFRKVSAAMRPECWGEWKGPEYGSEGGQTVRWADQHVGEWLRKLNPEVALLMFGSNDVGQMEVDEYRTKLRSVIQRCLDNGTVVLLSTLPPRHGFEKKSEQFAEAGRQVAREMKLPLVDYYAEILKRRPDDWDGALEKFKEYQDYDVPTLISRDGVHPSYPKQFQNDYSEQGLRSSGYTLRSYLVLMAYAGVLDVLRGTAGGQQSAAGGQQKAVSSGQKAGGGVPSRPWFPKAPALPAPTGPVTRVRTVERLYDAAARIQPGGTILLADGRYPLSRRLELRTDRVSLRGESGNRNAVVIDAQGLGEAVAVVNGAAGVTIADLSVENVKWNGIKIDSDSGVQALRIYNCVLHNVWQRFIKGVKVPVEGRERLRPKHCRIEYCLLYNDRPKQFSDDETDTPQTFDGNYIGGIDVMFPTDWTISDNVFTGIHGRTGECRGAVFLWQDARNVTVERNIILDCDSGICFGNSSKDPGTPPHCTGCVARNNFIVRCPENGILADYTQDCKILHNTIFDPEARRGRGMRIVHDNDGLVVANNLVVGPRILIELGAAPKILQNVTSGRPVLFKDPAAGNVRLVGLASGVTDSAPRRADVPEDIDGKPRGPQADFGAHELSPR
jgi:hypothetical protein